MFNVNDNLNKASRKSRDSVRRDYSSALRSNRPKNKINRFQHCFDGINKQTENNLFKSISRNNMLNKF